ncbi:MAG: hypothetical protein KGJ86_12195 [Chloroflexota bacterium]|nr:hypothetical protein [Chloroflexota bacterium]
MATRQCDSCGMPLDASRGNSPYCQHCVDENGNLQSRDERLERFTQWTMHQEGLPREAAQTKAMEHMKTMPAWKDAWKD